MEMEILPFKILGAQSKWNSPCLKSRGHHGKKKLDQNMLKISLLNFFVLTIMIHKYYYLFTRPSVIVVCWKSIFFKSLQFFQGRIIWNTFGWGALGAETLCLSGVKIGPSNTLGGNLGDKLKMCAPLGQKKDRACQVLYWGLWIKRRKWFNKLWTALIIIWC